MRHEMRQRGPTWNARAACAEPVCPARRSIASASSGVTASAVALPALLSPDAAAVPAAAPDTRRSAAAVAAADAASAASSCSTVAAASPSRTRRASAWFDNRGNAL